MIDEMPELENWEVKKLARLDAEEEATDEEAALLRSDQYVKRWYKALKSLRQDAEAELRQTKQAAKLSHRKAELEREAEELGLFIFLLNSALGEARDLVKDLNVRETAARTKRQNNGPPVTYPTQQEVLIDDAVLRADLRAAQRMMRRAYDFLRDDACITFKAMDVRDALLSDLEKELRGT